MSTNSSKQTFDPRHLRNHVKIVRHCKLSVVLHGGLCSRAATEPSVSRDRFGYYLYYAQVSPDHNGFQFMCFGYFRLLKFWVTGLISN